MVKKEWQMATTVHCITIKSKSPQEDKKQTQTPELLMSIY